MPNDYHPLSGPDCCIKLVAEGGDTSPARERLVLDDALRAKVEARLQVEPDADPLCRTCKTLVNLAGGDRWMYGWSDLPKTPEGIVYHLRAW